MSNNNYQSAFTEVIGNEGGFKKEAIDRMDWTSGICDVGILRGTKYGISAGTYPFLDIENLTLDEARDIYKKDWWDKFQGDFLPYELAYQVFDSEINHGHKVGVRFLQEAMDVHNDGVLGPVTLRAIGTWDEDKLIMRFLAIRMKYFTGCATWPTHGKGWARRVADNLIKATEPN